MPPRAMSFPGGRRVRNWRDSGVRSWRQPTRVSNGPSGLPKRGQSARNGFFSLGRKIILRHSPFAWTATGRVGVAPRTSEASQRLRRACTVGRRFCTGSRTPNKPPPSLLGGADDSVTGRANCQSLLPPSKLGGERENAGICPLEQNHRTTEQARRGRSPDEISTSNHRTPAERRATMEAFLMPRQSLKRPMTRPGKRRTKRSSAASSQLRRRRLAFETLERRELLATLAVHWNARTMPLRYLCPRPARRVRRPAVTGTTEARYAAVADANRVEAVYGPLPLAVATAVAENESRILAVYAAGAVADQFLAQQQATLFGVQDVAAELVPHQVQTDALGMTHLRLHQEYQGVPVYGSEVLVHLGSDQQVASANGRLVSEIRVDTTPQVSAGPGGGAGQAVFRGAVRGGYEPARRSLVVPPSAGRKTALKQALRNRQVSAGSETRAERDGVDARSCTCSTRACWRTGTSRSRTWCGKSACTARNPRPTNRSTSMPTPASWCIRRRG